MGLLNRFGASNPDNVFSSGLKFKLGHVERVFNEESDLSFFMKKYERTFSEVSQIIEFTPYSNTHGQPGASNKQLPRQTKLAHPLLRGFSDSITHGDLIFYVVVEGITCYLGPINTRNNPSKAVDHVHINTKQDELKNKDGYNKLVPVIKTYKVNKPTNKILDDPNDKSINFDGSLLDYESRVSDVVLEGRYNNHIRIGNRNVAPLISINNGVGNNQTGDGSLIFMSALGGIDDHLDTLKISNRDGENKLYNFILSCDDISTPVEDYMANWVMGMGNDSIDEQNKFNYEYGPVLSRKTEEDRENEKFPSKHQIFITSERIVFDAYGNDGDFTLSSHRNINLGAGNNFTLTNKGFTVIQSKNIYLGEASKERTQPMVLGNELNNLLKEIMDIMLDAHALVQGVPIRLVDSKGNFLFNRITQVIDKLNIKIERNYDAENKIPTTDRISGPAYLSHHHFIEQNRTT